MKIAMYVHCYFPLHVYGTEVLVNVMARELAAMGHEPVIVSAIFPGEPRQEQLVERYEWDGIPVISIDKNVVPHEDILGTYAQPVMRWVHERILRDIRPDFVHVYHLLNHTTAVLEAATALNIPVFATPTDFFGFCLTNRLEAANGDLCMGPNATRSNCISCHLKAASLNEAGLVAQTLSVAPIRPIAARALAALAKSRPLAKFRSLRPSDITLRPDRLRNAMAVYREAIAPSSFLRDAYLANGFPAKMRLVHFGLDIDRSPKPPPRDPTHVRLGYMGQIVPHKGVDILISGLRQAAQPNLSLTIWGDMSQNPAYQKKLLALAEGQNVTFAGRFAREDVAKVLAEVDVAAVPSTWYENSPQSLLEALATHTPVIVSDVAGLTEFVTHGQSGFVIPRGDVKAMARVLRDLGGNPSRAAELSLTTHFPRTLRDMAQDVVRMYADHGFV
jgi:glycosyltransferase involved in cell wall biosynthesis